MRRTPSQWAQVNARGNRGRTAVFPGGNQPSGTPYTGDANAGNIGVGAEIYLGAQGWVDITDYIYYRDGSTKVSVSRGKPDENSGSMPPPQTCSFQLNNRDSRFSPRNPLGPLYGLIGRNTPIRFWRMQNGLRRYRYYGEVPSWPSAADISGTDVYTSVTASGPLRRTTQGNKPLGSALRRNMLSIFRFRGISSTIFDYWPMEDGSNATQLSSGLAGREPMVYDKTAGISLAADSSYAASDPLPTLTTSVLGATVDSYTSTGVIALRWYMDVPSGGVTGSSERLITLYTTGSLSKITVQIDSSGDLWMLAYNRAGTEITGNVPVAFAVNGQKMIVGMDLVTSGSNINVKIYRFVLDNILTTNPFTGTLPSTEFTWTITSQTMGTVSRIAVNEDKALNGTTLGHIVLANDTGAYTSTLAGMAANTGEIPQNRMSRLCQETGVEFFGTSSSLDIPYSVTMGAQPSDSFLNLFAQAVTTDGGIPYEGTDRPGLLYRTLASLYNQSATLTLDYAQNQLSAAPTPVDDDLYIKNDVTVRRINGSFSRQTLDSGNMSVNDPPDGVGDYDVSVDVSLFDDSQDDDQAGWRVHMGTVDEARFPRISINLRHPTFQNSLDMMNAALSVDIGDVIQINNPDPWLSADPIRLVVIGYSEVMGAFEHDIVFNCAPESPYEIMVLDDPILSRADTDGSTLSGDLSVPLNTDGDFSTGVSTWTPTSCSVAQVGTSGSSNPLPAGGPTGYGALLTANGGASVQISQNLASFPVIANQTYFISALVYYPSAAHTVMLGMAWRDASNAFISSSTTFTAVTANTWTAIGLSFTAASTAVLGNPLVGLGGTPANGDTLYATNIAVWQGSVLVATTDSMTPLWTTSASDFPFDIKVAGERMTVTGISGASSPQTFTVARAVNGVNKPQSAGSDVRLWQPSIISL